MLEQRTFLHARSAGALAASLSLAACFGTTEPDPDWLAGNSPKPDAGKGDSGAEHDAACTDCDGGDHASTCNRPADCSGALPHCGPASTCVACLQSDHCSAMNPVCSGNACVACTGSDEGACSAQGKVCETGGTRCVECNANSECNAEASRCENHQCKPCQVDTDCMGVMDGTTALDACFNGVCVDCRVDSSNTKVDVGCTGNVACDPGMHTCTGKAKRSVGICGACLADAECADHHRCVEMSFEGDSIQPGGKSGGYCLLLISAPGDCPRPYRASPINRASRSGADVDSYCGVNEAKAACEAIRRFGADCPSGMASECDALGARCEDINGGMTCTYSCESANSVECPGGQSCPSGADPYCSQN